MSPLPVVFSSIRTCPYALGRATSPGEHAESRRSNLGEISIRTEDCAQPKEVRTITQWTANTSFLPVGFPCKLL